MSRDSTDFELVPSILDRLTDLEPDTRTEPAGGHAMTWRDVKDAVRRDLENLLNTRQVHPRLPADYEEAAQSVLTYGLPDFTQGTVGTPKERDTLRMSIEDVLQRFEPRLRHVKVTIGAAPNRFDRTLHLTIEGELVVHPYAEAVAFDTVVESTTGEVKMKPRGQ
jgi:type VI secretion system protein ImpF